VLAHGVPVRQGSLREHNLALVLRTVAASARPISRADIAGVTGLTRATVSALVDDLIAGRLLAESPPAPRTGAGRPAAGLALSAGGPAGLGLEVNVDYLAACVVDLTGAVRHRTVRRADQRPRPPGDVLVELRHLADAATADASGQGLVVAGAALAVPGLVDADGVVRFAPNLGWRDVPARAALAALSAGTLSIDNEANFAALGELHAGAERSFLYVSGEIGIGAGLVLDGRLVRGARGWSGEIGHVAVRPDGPECRCGARGCLERYAGEEAILAGAGLEGPPSGAVARLAEAAGAGQAAALAALDGAATALGVVVAGVVNLLDVDTVVLGGVYARLAPWLAPGVEREIAARVLTSRWSSVRVRASALGGDAAVLGAAGSVVRDVLHHPAGWLVA
jgi:predicted NBD/HSP70 family sugar kinase